MTQPTAKSRVKLPCLAIYLLSVLGIGLILLGTALVYLFTNLADFKPTLQRLVRKNTGYVIDFTKLTTSMNAAWQPTLLLDELSIKTATGPLLKIQRIEISLAYTSLFEFKPIFSLISIAGSNLIFEYDQNSFLNLNQQHLLNLATPSAGSSLDWENLILSQQNVHLANLNLSLIDSKHGIQPLNIRNIQLDLHNQQNKHKLVSQAHLANSNLQMQIDFSGNRFSRINDWQIGNIQIKNQDLHGYLLNLSAQVKNGSIQSVASTFNTNQQPLTKISSSIAGINNISGNFNFSQGYPGIYNIQAQDLTLATEYGYIFKHAAISGKIDLSHGGALAITNLNLEGINSFLRLTRISDKIQVAGTLAAIRIHWQNKLLAPESLQIATQFSKLNIKSHEVNIPSLNNISGQLVAGMESGQLELRLTASELNYPKYLVTPLNITKFSTQIDWQIESQNLTKLNWQNLNLQTPKLVLSSSGSYYLQERRLSAFIQIKNFALDALSSYLPKLSSAHLRDYLHTNLTSGTLNNTLIKFDGNPANFPFKRESGVFNIVGTVDNGTFKYLNGYPPVSKIKAKLTANKQKVSLNITHAEIAALHLQTINLSVADISESAAYLDIKAKTTNLTSDYLASLSQTPYNAKISPIQDKFLITGFSTTTLSCRIPFANPAAFKLSGSFQPEQNELQLIKYPTLNIEAINGKINFSQRGLAASDLSATSLNSQFNLHLDPKRNITLSSPNLDYGFLSSKASPNLAQIISGHAATTISYSNQNGEILAQSALSGVSIKAPAPLGKAADQETPTLISFTKTAKNGPEVNLNYADSLYARASLSESYQFKRLKIALNTNNYQLDNPISAAKITLNGKFNNLHIEEWVDFINQLTTDPAAKHIESAILKTQNREESEIKLIEVKEEQLDKNLNANSSSIYPLQIQIKSAAYWFKNYDLDGGTLNLVLRPESFQAQIDTPDIKGTAVYFSESHNLSLNMDRVLYSSANIIPVRDNKAIITESDMPESGFESIPTQLLESGTQGESQLISTQASSGAAPVMRLPTIHLFIRQLYYQNHFLGSLSGEVYQQDNSIYLNSLVLSNKSGVTYLNLTDNCIACNESHEFVALNVHSDIDNFGLYVLKLNQGDMFTNGKGTLDMGVHWKGNLVDFAPNKVSAIVELKLKNGQLDHVNPGLFGTLMGVINLRPISISNLDQFNFNNFFGKGMVYNSLSTHLDLKQNQLKIVELNMAGQAATISSFGTLNLDNKQIDSYLTIQPRLGSTIAATAGIVTLNPFIGMFVYLGDFLIGDPINKAFAVSYHIHGNVESPTMTRDKISKQLLQNVSSSLNIFNQ